MAPYIKNHTHLLHKLDGFLHMKTEKYGLQIPAVHQFLINSKPSEADNGNKSPFTTNEPKITIFFFCQNPKLQIFEQKITH